jgi:hypothetical protein
VLLFINVHAFLGNIGLELYCILLLQERDLENLFLHFQGRTGLMICAYLVYSRECGEPITAIRTYGEKRTKNGKVKS